MSDEVLEFLESFDRFDGVEHVLAMHILCETGLKSYIKKQDLGNALFDLCEKSCFDFDKVKEEFPQFCSESRAGIEGGLNLLLRRRCHGNGVTDRT